MKVGPRFFHSFNNPLLKPRKILLHSLHAVQYNSRAKGFVNKFIMQNDLKLLNNTKRNIAVLFVQIML